jgi:hypothetical protein
MVSDAEKKEQALTEYRSKLQKHKEIDTKVRALREAVKELKKEYDKTEDDLKALQVRPASRALAGTGQIVGYMRALLCWWLVGWCCGFGLAGTCSWHRADSWIHACAVVLVVGCLAGAVGLPAVRHFSRHAAGSRPRKRGHQAHVPCAGCDSRAAAHACAMCARIGAATADNCGKKMLQQQALGPVVLCTPHARPVGGWP